MVKIINKLNELENDLKQLDKFQMILFKKEYETGNSYENVSLFYDTLYSFDSKLFNRIVKHLRSKHIIHDTTTYKDMFRKHINVYKTLYKIDLKDMILI